MAGASMQSGRHSRRIGSWIRVNRLSVCVLLVVGVLAGIIFVRMSGEGINSDLRLHVLIAVNQFANGRWYSYTLWSPLIMIVSGNRELISIRLTVVALLSVAVMARVVATSLALRRWGPMRDRGLLVSVALLVAAPVLGAGIPARNGHDVGGLFGGAIYLGRLSGAVWHNSTFVAAAPLVLLAAHSFWLARRRPTLRSWVMVGAAFAICALMKPNYPLAALPVLAVAAWTHHPPLQMARWRQRAVALSIGTGPTVLVLMVQARLVQSDTQIVPSRFVLEPFEVWSYYAPPLLALAQSLLFPVVATVAISRARPVPGWLWTCWAIFGVAALQLALLGERNRVTGDVIYDGNWFWGAHSATMVLFVAATAALGAIGREAVGARWRWAAWGAFALHVGTGLIYLVRLFTSTNGFAT